MTATEELSPRGEAGRHRASGSIMSGFSAVQYGQQRCQGVEEQDTHSRPEKPREKCAAAAPRSSAWTLPSARFGALGAISTGCAFAVASCFCGTSQGLWLLRAKHAGDGVK